MAYEIGDHSTAAIAVVAVIAAIAIAVAVFFVVVVIIAVLLRSCGSGIGGRAVWSWSWSPSRFGICDDVRETCPLSGGGPRTREGERFLRSGADLAKSTPRITESPGESFPPPRKRQQRKSPPPGVSFITHAFQRTPLLFRFSPRAQKICPKVRMIPDRARPTMLLLVPGRQARRKGR